MKQKNPSFEIMEVPVSTQNKKDLLDFWASIFGEGYLSDQNISPVLSGKEKAFNRDFVFIARIGKKIVSTVHLTTSKFDKRIGGIGEVATHQNYRGRGFARILCEMAIDAFEKMDGAWLFLGTSNPAAARLYHSLGWHYITGSRVMFRDSHGKNPEVFFKEYFEHIRKHNVGIVRGDMRFRLQVIPITIIPYDGPVLDLNAGLFSTRWFMQRSCMGLYPRYEKIDDGGAWFVALSGKFIAGIASVKFHEGNIGQIDGFCSSETGEDVLSDLYNTAIRYALKNRVREIHTVSDILDVKKMRFLSKLGCIPTDERIRIESKEAIIDAIVYKFLL